MLSSAEAFWWGIAGGVAAEILAVLPYRKLAWREWPKWTRRVTYWAFAIAMIPLAGLLALILTGEREVTTYLAFHTGVAAPLLLERLAANAPDLGVGEVS